MVSKASEDFPEPDRPVNTTSLSRGISRSTFLRLCSRAPRMVIARMPEPEVDWRFALITSSIAGISWRAGPRSVRARIAGNTGIGRQWVNSERRKNAAGFPVLPARHQRFVAGRVSMAADGNAATNKKAGARPAFSNLKPSKGSEDQYLA